jgi:histidinol phosphatase-like enzyme (inositol monophosphatase family)
VTLPQALSEALDFAGRLADAGRPVALEHFRSGLGADNKLTDGFDPVTAADRGVEAVIRSLIAEHRPTDGIIGEEGDGVQSRSGLTWVIGPIDGTRGFIAGLPTWTTLIALQDESGPLVSVIDQPFTGERFLGATAHGAWLDHGGVRRPISVRRGASSLGDAILSTTDPGLFQGSEVVAFASVLQRAKVCRYGLDAYAYAALGLGGIDLVVETGLKSWDAAALIPVVTGAGGVVTDWAGKPCHAGGQVLAAATAELHAEVLEHLTPAAAN